MKIFALKQVKYFLLILVFIMNCNTVFANDSDILVYYNNQKVEFDISPTIINDSVMVPARYLFEAMEIHFEWNEKESSISFFNGNRPLTTIYIGEKTAKQVGYPDIQLDVAPTIINGRTLIPVRFVAEQLDKNVVYDEASSSVYIEDRIKDDMYKDTVNNIAFKIDPNMDNDFFCHNISAEGGSYAQISFVNAEFPGSLIVSSMQDVMKFSSENNFNKSDIIDNPGILPGDVLYTITYSNDVEGIYSGYAIFEHMSHRYKYKVYMSIKTIGEYVYFMSFSVDDERTDFNEDTIINCLKSIEILK